MQCVASFSHENGSQKNSVYDLFIHNLRMFFFRAVETSVAIICHNDELSSSLRWLDCLLTDSEVFILSAEINQVLLKISFIPILLTFMYLVALYQKSEL